MTIEIPDSVRRNTAKCPHEFECLENGRCGERELCKVAYSNGENMLRLSGNDQFICPYRMSFGSGQLCSCPVRWYLDISPLKRAGTMNSRRVAIGAELGISSDLIAARGLHVCEEATDLDIGEIGADGREHLLVPAAAEAWRKLKATALGDGVALFIVSAFRSIDRQAEIVRKELETGAALEEVLTVCAPPGFSEHHTGRAVDLSTPGSRSLEVEFDQTSAFRWLSMRGAEFGCYLSYPVGNQWGYQYEPWHWCFNPVQPGGHAERSSRQTLDIMNNTWLDVPLADYERHMALPGIEQAQMLSDIFAGAIEQFAPKSVAVLGCAGGNGFERIPASVSRVVGIDINPAYIAKASARFDGQFESVELIVGDIQDETIAFTPVELLFAGLILEYVNVETVIARTRSLVTAKGRLITALQLPGAGSRQVSPSPFSSVQALADSMRLVSPLELKKVAETNGYIQMESRTVVSAGSKQFQVQVFKASRRTTQLTGRTYKRRAGRF